ncbi:(2Fe-2S)-binding protein [Rhizobium sp. P38BS-XIX]|uniref:(2Fe-2S)-binding protein n=1 Tax=Rhizobium sp. P38BS-XIX TaxID=2726740 RepID=UPI0014571B0D|nr:(2Fe-2S)-binding protein [Rhizobium sp. P38BS-XIX]NLS01726.1 (2Fe-2S)-binding protein [Rhizobium sp. P38BS-XIX]
MSKTFVLDVNGRQSSVTCGEDTPLLYVLRNDLELNGPKFGCGLGQCGACTILLDGQAARSCITPIGTVDGQKIVTLDGLSADGHQHPLQTAFISLEAAQCGYCTNGMIMTAKALLDREKLPSADAIKEELSGNLCRCGVHNRIVDAIQHAAKEMAR